MQPLMQRDEVSGFDYAVLYDKVRTPQRFGNESVCENGVFKATNRLKIRIT